MLQYFSLSFSIPFSHCLLLLLYYPPHSSLPSTCRVDGRCWYLSHQHLPEVFVSSCKTEKHYSEITSSLMRPESQLQSIQCNGNSFLLDISELPSLLYVHNTRPYQWNFWKVTLNDRIYIWFVLRLSDEILLLGPPPPTFPFTTYSWDFKLNTLTTIYSSLDQSTSSAKA